MKTALILSVCTIVVQTGCKQQKVADAPLGPDYNRQLRPGESALRLITDPARMPDLAAAYRNRTWELDDAIDQSVSWFKAPSSKTHFPFQTITHDQARVSLAAFQQVLQSSSDETEFVAQIIEKFDVHESVGYNDEGIVLFTGYYSPIFPASLTRSDRFRHALYRRPADLATDPKSGKPLGRKLPDGSTVPYYTRAEIDSSSMFTGNELVWVEDALSAYIIHVNGSAKLRLPDGSEMYIGYSGKTDRQYVGLGKTMLDEGLLARSELGLPAIRKAFRANPQKVIELMNRNESYVFFTEYQGDLWPSGSLGRRVTAETSLATDKSIYPRGGIVMVDTKAVTLSMGPRTFQKFMLDQDTGGAINAPGRADIFMGIGGSAEILAGGQYAEGRLYYLFVKPQFMDQYSHMVAERNTNSDAASLSALTSRKLIEHAH